MVFLLATGFFLNDKLASDLDLLGVSGFAIIFFTLTLGLASCVAEEPRWGGNGTNHANITFKQFAEDNVSTATGTISGRAALVQILVLPVTLAFGMVTIGLIFVLSS